MINWIIWNRTVFCIRIDLAINNLQKNQKTQTNEQTNQRVIAGIRLYMFLEDENCGIFPGVCFQGTCDVERSNNGGLL